MNHPTLRLWDGYPHTNPGFRDEVNLLQSLLAQASYPIAIDGYFGPGTEAIVERYQIDMDLEDDGIVGPKTWSTLLDEPVLDGVYFDTTYGFDNFSLRNQLAASREYREYIEEAAVMAAVPVAIVWGIGSRESHWGLALDALGTGDYIQRNTKRAWRQGRLPADGGGFGRGLMQIDYDAHEFARTGNWQDPQANIRYGGKVLRDCTRYFVNHGYGISPNIERMAVASYNCGPGNVRRAVEAGRSIDYYTHGRDYSSDVMSRAGWFQRNGWESE